MKIVTKLCFTFFKKISLKFQFFFYRNSKNFVLGSEDAKPFLVDMTTGMVLPFPRPDGIFLI